MIPALVITVVSALGGGLVLLGKKTTPPPINPMDRYINLPPIDKGNNANKDNQDSQDKPNDKPKDKSTSSTSKPHPDSSKMGMPHHLN